MTNAPDPAEFPAAALDALRRGNKIEAIRIVRAGRGLDLKDAKDAVERYVAGDPVLQAQMRSRRVEIGGGQLLRFVVLTALAVAAYYWLKGG